MAVLQRVNKKTGFIEFKIRYVWKDSEGKYKDSKTGWFLSLEEAEAEAKRLKFEKEKDAKTEYANRKEQKIGYVLDVWIKVLEERANRETTENTTTENSVYRKACTVRTKYMPESIAKVILKDATETTFRMWLTYINGLKLSGRTIRGYKTVLIKFNQYLGANGYYSDPDLDRRIDTTLARAHIKPRAAGERKDRRIPTVQDIEDIVSYYEVMGLGEFKNFYWYTLWYVLFYSGLRVSELIGLQWKFIDLKRDTIDIKNSISERELRENVLNRVQQEIYHTKNTRSERIIPIFAKYSQLLVDYKKSFMHHFELTEKEMKDCFVFPLVLQTKEDLHDYQKQKNILRELDIVCKIQGLEKTDVQMMRHGCATWMVSDRRDGGLGFSESQAKDYFGHTGDDMLREVYAKLNKKQRARRTITTFSTLMVDKPKEDPQEITNQIELSELVLHPELNEEIIEESRYQRIKAEIKENIKNKKGSYVFYDDDIAEIGHVISDYNEMGIDLLDIIALIWEHNGERVLLKNTPK